MRTEVGEDVVESLLKHYSSWYRLKRGVAWILKIKERLMKPKQATADSQQLSADDMKAAEIAIVRSIQRKAFSNEMRDVTESNVRISSPIYRLDPTLDDGVLRVGGRLKNSAMPEKSKHPVILPKGHPIVHLILRDIHERKGHVGRNHMLAIMHEIYWAAAANASARKVVNDCITCKRQRGKLYKHKRWPIYPPTESLRTNHH